MPSQDYNFEFLEQYTAPQPPAVQEGSTGHRREATRAEVNPERAFPLPPGAGVELDFDSLYGRQQAAESDNRSGGGTSWRLSGDLNSNEPSVAAVERREAGTDTAPPVEPEPAAPAVEPLEAPQDTPEVDPRKVPLFAGGWGVNISPDAHPAYGIIRYDPTATIRYRRRQEYLASEVEPENRISPQVAQLLRNRDFARTGEIAPKSVQQDSRGVERFYDDVRARLGLTEKPRKNVGTTLVRVDGYTLLSLGIDTMGDNRGQLSFGAKGNLSQGEIMRRARAVFPELFENTLDKFTISEEPRQVIDIAPEPAE